MKQSSIVYSTMKAEYITASEAANEVVWLKIYLMDLKVVPFEHPAITLYCDNTGAIVNSKEPNEP